MSLHFLLLCGVSQRRQSLRTIQSYRSGTIKQSGVRSPGAMAWRDSWGDSLLKVQRCLFCHKGEWLSVALRKRCMTGVICFSPKRPGTRTSFHKPQCPLSIMTSFFTWSKAQKSNYQMIPIHLKTLICLSSRQGKVTSCSRPVWLRSAFLFLQIIPFSAHAREPGAKTCESSVTYT